MAIAHSLLPSKVPAQLLEEQRKMSCWHLLTVALTIVASAFACFILVRNVTFYAHADGILEACTENWNEYYPCHYLFLWLKYHGPENVYDISRVLTAIYLFSIILSTHYLIASVILIVGIAKGWHLALIPWMVVKILVVLTFASLVGAEIVMPDITSNDLLMISAAALAFALFSGITASVTYWQLKKHNTQHDNTNNLSYEQFSH